MTPTATLLLSNKWVSFYSAEPDFQLRAILEVSFPTPTSIHFKKTILFSELGLGDDLVLTIDSPITVGNASFNVPTTITKTGTNPQGQTGKLQLTGQDYGIVPQWGRHQIAILGRVYSLQHS